MSCLQSGATRTVHPKKTKKDAEFLVCALSAVFDTA